MTCAPHSAPANSAAPPGKAGANAAAPDAPPHHAADLTAARAALQATLRAIITAGACIAAWALLAAAARLPTYILPGPASVARALWRQRALLANAAGVTATETLLGLVLGGCFGALAALAIAAIPALQRWLMPLLLASQAIPVFALAPLLVLWLGFGLAAKTVTAALIIFFPVTSAFADGLRRTDPGWLDLARSMGASRHAILWHVRVPAALPALASGLRVAVVIAPLGAVIGEWVGASAGLGYVMLTANARLATDLMFAAVVILTVFTLLLWSAANLLLARLTPWSP